MKSILKKKFQADLPGGPISFTFFKADGALEGGNLEFDVEFDKGDSHLFLRWDGESYSRFESSDFKGKSASFTEIEAAEALGLSLADFQTFEDTKFITALEECEASDDEIESFFNVESELKNGKIVLTTDDE